MIEGSRSASASSASSCRALLRAVRAALVPPGRGGTNLAAAAQREPVRTVTEPAPRGRILDAKGRVLVDNRVANVITVDRRLEPTQRERRSSAGSRRCSATTGRRRSTSASTTRGSRRTPPVPVGVDVPIDTLAYIGEHKADFPGVRAEPRRGAPVPAGSSRRTCSATSARSTRRSSSRAARRATYQLGDDDREVGRGADLRVGPPRDARARSGSRSTCRVGCSSTLGTHEARSRVTTCSSPSTSTCRTSPRTRSQRRMAAAQRHAGQGVQERLREATPRRRARWSCSTRRPARSSRWRRTRRTTRTSSPTASPRPT